ncbi:Uncharacterized protein conserved in bacteria [Cedecea neteri]|uniref:Uncharacterized protein conserved in bacteria n=1 Tax=Cedecea neteri TaxID=158822 RepID=A0A2X2TFF4_9ENTR|nr:Uncharacterized protein conserved in bacteria [Cedecea neteri]
MEARIPPCKVGILGTSLSGIDAAMAVVIQHGEFVQTDDGHLEFLLDEGSEGLEIVLMSRSGILPEADFTARSPMNLYASSPRRRWKKRLPRDQRACSTGSSV